MQSAHGALRPRSRPRLVLAARGSGSLAGESAHEPSRLGGGASFQLGPVIVDRRHGVHTGFGSSGPARRGRDRLVAPAQDAGERGPPPAASRSRISGIRMLRPPSPGRFVSETPATPPPEDASLVLGRVDAAARRARRSPARLRRRTRLSAALALGSPAAGSMPARACRRRGAGGDRAVAGGAQPPPLASSRRRRRPVRSSRVTRLTEMSSRRAVLLASPRRAGADAGAQRQDAALPGAQVVEAAARLA